MSAFKNLVFSDIRSDYLKNGKRSFLYRYLRNGKLKEKCDKEPQKEEALIHKAATDLMYNQGYPLAKPDVIMDDKTDYAMMADGISPEEAERRQKEKTRNDSGKESAKKQAEKKNPPKKRTEIKSRTHNTLLDLIEAWYDEREGAARSFTSISDYQILFDELNKSDNTEILIPVRIDQMTGAGLYIMGKDNYPEDRFPYGEDHSCGLCIVSEWITLDEGVGVSQIVADSANDDLGSCDNVDEALKFFDNYLRTNQFYDIQGFNRNMPRNTPESLKMYFEHNNEEDDFDVITAEERAESLEDYNSAAK